MLQITSAIMCTARLRTEKTLLDEEELCTIKANQDDIN